MGVVEEVMLPASNTQPGCHSFLHKLSTTAVAAAAIGTFNEAVRDAALTRSSDAGAVLINWFAVACELQKDWRRPPAAGQGLADLLSTYLPEYGNLINSYLVASNGGNTSAARAAPAINSGH